MQRIMTDRILTAFVIALGVAAMAFQAWAKPRPSTEEVNSAAQMFFDAKLWENRIAPDFELTLLDGSTFRVADHAGKDVIVLNFFATWCGPCRTEMPELERYYREHAQDGV